MTTEKLAAPTPASLREEAQIAADEAVVRALHQLGIARTKFLAVDDMNAAGTVDRVKLLLARLLATTTAGG